MTTSPLEHDPSTDLELLTITRLWLFENKVYNIGQKALIVPVSVRAIGYAAAVFLPMSIVLSILGVSWVSSATAMFFRVALPGMIVWLALRYVSAGGKAHELVLAWVGYTWCVVRNAFRSSTTTRSLVFRSRVQRAH